MHLLQAIYLGSMKYEDIALFVSKIWHRPLLVIDYKVRSLLGTTKPIGAFDQMKLMMFDAHDTQAVNSLTWLQPTNVSIP